MSKSQNDTKGIFTSEDKENLEINIRTNSFEQTVTRENSSLVNEITILTFPVWMFCKVINKSVLKYLSLSVASNFKLLKNFYKMQVLKITNNNIVSFFCFSNFAQERRDAQGRLQDFALLGAQR